MNIRFPCKNCPDRKRACHDTCEKYQAVREKRKLERDERLKEHMIHQDINYRAKKLKKIKTK